MTMARHLLCKLHELEDGGVKAVVCGTVKIIATRRGKTVVAYRNHCPHMGGPLRTGKGEFTCLWHGARFDAETGKSVSGPAEGTTLETMSVTVEGDDVFVELERKKSPWALEF